MKKKGKVVQSDSFGLAYLDRKDKKISLYGFVVSTNISKDAHHRNRVRRAISEAVRFLVKDVKNGFNIVFLAKKESLRNPTDQIMREVPQALKKAGLMV